jgi:hypothetical protein
MANSSHTATRQQVEIGKGANSKRVEIVTTSWVADDAAATVPTLSLELKGFVLKVVTNPGSTAPTANYDISVTDPEDSALDAMATLLNNRHTSTTEQVYPLISGAACPIFLCGTYGIAVANNAVNSATGTITFYLVDSL